MNEEIIKREWVSGRSIETSGQIAERRFRNTDRAIGLSELVDPDGGENYAVLTVGDIEHWADLAEECQRIDLEITAEALEAILFQGIERAIREEKILREKLGGKSESGLRRQICLRGMWAPGDTD